MFLIILSALTASANKMEPFIVGGHGANIENWPFIAYVDVRVGFMSYGCGGTLISSQTVLTAAHCLDDITNKNRGTSFDIYMGHNWHFFATIYRSVTGYETHEEYSPTDDLVEYDIGIMFLSSPVVFSNSVQKAILKRSFSYKVDRNVMVAGWGRFTQYWIGGSWWLQAAEMEARNFRSCKDKLHAICTFGAHHDIYPFQGDSGGPLVMADTRQLVGIVSYRHEHTGISVFTRVPDYYDWIEETQLMLFKKYCGRK